MAKKERIGVVVSDKAEKTIVQLSLAKTIKNITITKEYLRCFIT